MVPWLRFVILVGRIIENLLLLGGGGVCREGLLGVITIQILHLIISTSTTVVPTLVIVVVVGVMVLVIVPLVAPNEATIVLPVLIGYATKGVEVMVLMMILRGL